MRKTLFAGLMIAGVSCGVPKEFVKQETRTAFDNAGSVVAHVKLKCGDPAATAADENCKQARDKLDAICHALDELSRKAGAAGFDCATWKVNP